ncbi:MAG: cytochrome c maturation protein CcmE [Longimicrobiales bacterium]
MKNGRFFAGLVGVAGVITYLIWTGIDSSMVYYLTPTELMAQVEEDPTFHDMGVKVSGRVVPGSYSSESGTLNHKFHVADLDNEGVTFPVVYNDILPDTFNDEVEVVVEGTFGADGVFQAHTVLTKCGSRYEATAEELAA